MNGTYKPGGNMNLSGTQGLGLDMEPWAYEARGRNSGLRQGRREGYDEGLSKGRSKGFGDGFLRGVQAGREQAWDEANDVIEKLNEDFRKERIEANNVATSMNALRRTVETLIEKNPNSARYIRSLFRDNYEDEVRSGLNEGSVNTAPHLDPNFRKNSPRMSRFLLDSM